MSIARGIVGHLGAAVSLAALLCACYPERLPGWAPATAAAALLVVLLARHALGAACDWSPIEAAAAVAAAALLALDFDSGVRLALVYGAMRLADRPALPLLPALAPALMLKEEPLSVALPALLVLTPLLLFGARAIPALAVAAVAALVEPSGAEHVAIRFLLLLPAVLAGARAARHAPSALVRVLSAMSLSAALLSPVSSPAFAAALVALVCVDRFWHTLHKNLKYRVGESALLASDAPQDIAQLLFACPFDRLVKKVRAERETGYVDTIHGKIYLKRARLNLLAVLGRTLVKLRVPFTSFLEEGRVLVHLAARSVAATRFLGAATQTRLFARRTALATADLGPFERLEELAPQLSGEARRRETRRAAALVASLHASGVNHRDLYACHLVHTEKSDWALLDLNRAQLRHRVPTRMLVKDLAALAASTPTATRTDMVRFLLAYAGKERLDPSLKRLARRTAARVERTKRRIAREKEKEARFLAEAGGALPPRNASETENPSSGSAV